MIVPQYWAEGRVQARTKRRQVTVRRWGWSDVSPEDAQAKADARARDALARLQQGEKVQRREPKVSYNGAEGLPIREEVLSRHGETVITRNIYGAQCLNTPDVLFADIDFPDDPGGGLGCLIFLAGTIGAAALGTRLHSLACAVGVLAAALLAWWGVKAWRRSQAPQRTRQKETKARGRVEEFARAHPDWHLRLYRTPRGFRVLVMHRKFDPGEPDVLACFNALSADRVYVRMCQRQRCFRARVSPKPWRIGMPAHIKPRPGVWPVKPERMPDRQNWIAKYEQAAGQYASCHFVAALGGSPVDPEARAVQILHDDLCRAGTTLPLA